MAFRKNTALRTAQADAMADQWDGGTLKIYTGSQPASADDAATGTLLATINLPTPAFGAAASGVVSKSGTWSAIAVATGTAGWGRFETAAGAKKMDVTIAEAGGDLTIDNDAITINGAVTVTAFTITVPAS